jgi:hypothetical protein
MQFAKAALVSALFAAFSGPVFAQATITSDTAITNAVTVSGGVGVGGGIAVNGEAAAVTDNAQASVGNLVITLGGANNAAMDNAANGIAGNAGVNVASGTGNAQSNDAALASLSDAANVFASAQSFSSQVSAVNANIALLTNNTATMTNSGNGAVGNVGANVVSGSGNMQSNQLAAASQATVAGNGTLAKATGSNEQLIALTLNGNLDFNLTNNAVIANSLNNASGNVGANVAAGYGNLQHNSLSIASSR